MTKGDEDKNGGAWRLESMLSGPRPLMRSVVVGASFSAQALGAGLILWAGYSLTGAGGLNWAIISAIVVLQPELQQSLAASLSRVAANLVGALAGLAVAATAGVSVPSVLGAVVVTAVACGVLRLDVALRTACVAAIIVMTTQAHPGHVVLSGAERFLSTTVGCAVAVVIQLTTHGVLRAVRAQEGGQKSMGSQE
jgi:uncharacterized membrane protein YgaE (UPF0421/DUF939 family)